MKYVAQFCQSPFFCFVKSELERKACLYDGTRAYIRSLWSAAGKSKKVDVILNFFFLLYYFVVVCFCFF